MKNILISLGVSLAVILLFGALGINAFITGLIMSVTPTFIYSKLTTYKTKPFIIASVVGLLSSFLAYFVLQIVVVMFGLGEGVVLNMAYVSVLIGSLLSVLIYRQLNNSQTVSVNIKYKK